MDATKATLHNWMTHPFNQYAFVHMDQIMASETIKKPQTHSPLPEQLRDFSSFSLSHNGEKLNLEAYLSRTHTDGLMLLQNDTILYETYANNNTPASKHIVMSLTKSLTGLLIGIVQSHGKLSVNDPVTKYVPEVEHTIWKTATIQQCLDMRSRAKYADGQHAYRAASGWHPLLGGEQHTTLKQFLQHFEPDEV